ncbi:MAG: thiamine pyrophosphate-binding protein [Proteobacteria bacterium]|nr:thiamine pyrophosphate-binding protein [Pseudomonadota bacterium]
MSNYPSGEVPRRGQSSGLWGSDVIAEAIRGLGFDYVALNPGSSFRGLHDSLVNHLHNEKPQMILCLHEENAVSIAHGWAKVTGKPMAVVLHANVGLMHAAMAIYNAWCDRVPMVIFGATGPVDASVRRPWIDSLHTSRDQAAVIRQYIKWDDQPASLQSAVNSVQEATLITETYPKAPTYVCLDVGMQETAVTGPIKPPAYGRYATPSVPNPSAAELDRLCEFLDSAQKPVFMLGRMSNRTVDWFTRVAVAEHWNAQVITDIKTGAIFPTNHTLHTGPASFFLSLEQEERLRQADLIVCFDFVDAGATLARAECAGTIVNVTLDHVLKNGWSFDQGQAVFSDLHIGTSPDACFAALAEQRKLNADRSYELAPRSTVELQPESLVIDMGQLAAALSEGSQGDPITLVRLPLGWDASHWHFLHPMDYLGYDGGAGIGSGPGMLVGAALALQNQGRIPVAVLGDGDTMMGLSALWTASHYRVPLLLVVCNNQSFFNDEVHQEKVARTRGRPVENKAIGQAITDPEIDFAKLAQAQGLIGVGPVHTPSDLLRAITSGLKDVKNGASVLIDARVRPSYSQTMNEGMTQS